MEGNLCWNCRHLVSCDPEKRPKTKGECPNFQPMCVPLTAKQIAEILGIKERSVRSFVKRNETDKIVGRIKAKDKNIGFFYRNGKIKFYRIDRDSANTDKN